MCTNNFSPQGLADSALVMFKILMFASLVSLAYSQIGDGVFDPRCPEGTPNPTRHLNDPNDCRKFFKCANGLAVPFECPQGDTF